MKKQLIFSTLIIVMSFSLGITASFFPDNAYAFDCENDFCTQLELPDGSKIAACADHSVLPGAQENWNCDAEDQTCTLVICGL